MFVSDVDMLYSDQTSLIFHTLIVPFGKIPKKSPVPSRIAQNTFGLNSLFVDESVMLTQFVVHFVKKK